MGAHIGLLSGALLAAACCVRVQTIIMLFVCVRVNGSARWAAEWSTAGCCLCASYHAYLTLEST